MSCVELISAVSGGVVTISLLELLEVCEGKGDPEAKVDAKALDSVGLDGESALLLGLPEPPAGAVLEAEHLDTRP